jgi:anthranilate synthase/aminodeoxychorismate synthase-like glutamine amidotransferase
VILLLDNHDSFTWNLAELLRITGKEPIKVMSSQDFSVRDLCSFSRIVFSPGPGLPDEQPKMMTVLKKIEEKHSEGDPVPPVLGVCLGMQAIVLHFGGTLFNLPSVVHGQPRSLTLTDPSDSLFREIPQGSVVGLYHSWAVESTVLPDCLKAAAFSNEGVLMAIRHTTLPIHGVQFHPESIITQHGKELMMNWRDGGSDW